MTRAWCWLMAVAFVGGFLLLGCPKPTPPPVTPTDADAGPPTTCLQACDHVIAKLKCQTFGCLRVCDDVADQRFTDCMARAPSCEAVDRCDVMAPR